MGWLGKLQFGQGLLRAALCLLMIIGIFLPGTALAAEKSSSAEILKQALLLYNQGRYADTIAALEKIQGDRQSQSTVLYWKGHCQFKLKDYTLAIASFEASIKSSAGKIPEDLYYTLGQSYYASQRLQEAKGAFLKSIDQNFKPGASNYYAAYIDQTLEQNKQAAMRYIQILKMRGDEDKVKQAAIYQIAEMKYGAIREAKKDERLFKHLEKEIIPLYERARDWEDGTTTHDESVAKLNEIQSYIAKNRPRSPWTIRATFAFGYDSNVITQADQAVTSVSQKDSYYFNPTLRANYASRLSPTWTLDAGMRAETKLYSRQGVGAVYKNDNLTFEPSANLEKSHTLFAKPAAMLFNFEFNYQLQDYQTARQFPWYSRYYNFEAGERFNPFQFGETTFKGMFKYYQYYDANQDSLQPSLELNQKTKIGANSLSTTLGADWLIAKLNTNSTTTYKLYNRYPIDLPKNWNITPKLNLSLLNPLLQFASRGMEKKINPGVSLRKSMPNGSVYRLNYDFTRNLSLDQQNYQYTRHDVSLSYEMRF